MFRFLPLGLPATRLHQAWLGWLIGIGWNWLATARTLLEGRRAFFSGDRGLAFQAQREHLLGQNFADFNDQVFQLRQFGAPLRSLRSPDAVRQVFGDAFNVGPDFFYFLTPFLSACYPWFLLEVKAKLETNLPRECTTSCSCLTNHVPHPFFSQAVRLDLARER